VMILPEAAPSGDSRQRSEQPGPFRIGGLAATWNVEDCGKVVEFLATDLSDYVTGAVIPIDGGLVRG
jgi:NAD(P)-dependent dehydrogenase (short-subunit alcohol dehydrogenase family)